MADDADEGRRRTKPNGTARDPAIITWHVEGGVARATIDRPEKRNALDIATVAELADRLSVDGEIAPPVVLTGAGTTFCSGFDLSTRDQGSDFVEHAHRLFASLTSYPAPVIAALKGPAVGMGCVLAAHCDLRVGCEGSWLEIPAARLGVTLAEEYVAVVTRRLGLATAQLLFVGSRRIEGRRAAELGAIHALAEDPANLASLWAAHAASVAPTSLAAHKSFVNRAQSP